MSFHEGWSPASFQDPWIPRAALSEISDSVEMQRLSLFLKFEETVFPNGTTWGAWDGESVTDESVEIVIVV